VSVAPDAAVDPEVPLESPALRRAVATSLRIGPITSVMFTLLR